MESLKEKLQRIARQKIARTQIQSTKSKSSKAPTSTKSTKSAGRRAVQPKQQTAKRIRQTPQPKNNEIQRKFFPATPLNFYRYNRPHEARLQSKYEQIVLKNFATEYRERQRTNNFNFEQFLLDAQKRQ